MSVLTSLDATSAEDALGSISYETRSNLIKMCLGLSALESAFSCASNVSDMEQLALSVLVALLAVHVVVGEQELYAVSSCCYSCRRRDLDLHALSYRINAACYESSCTCCLYETNTAGTLVAFTVVECAK